MEKVREIVQWETEKWMVKMFGLSVDRCRLLMSFSSEWTCQQSGGFQLPLRKGGEERDRKSEKEMGTGSRGCLIYL